LEKDALGRATPKIGRQRLFKVPPDPKLFFAYMRARARAFAQNLKRDHHNLYFSSFCRERDDGSKDERRQSRKRKLGMLTPFAIETRPIVTSRHAFASSICGEAKACHERNRDWGLKRQLRNHRPPCTTHGGETERA